jgi:hypothetical protein
MTGVALAQRGEHVCRVAVERRPSSASSARGVSVTS